MTKIENDNKGTESGYTFIYPKSRQFGEVDEICSKIVRELERRNWNVPGIEVKFGEYGAGERKVRHVQYLRGENFKIWFCRVQGSLGGGLNDVAAVTEIIISQRQLNLYEDESGPTFDVYVGDNWNRDRDWFLNSSKVNSKLRNEPRRYLRFSGGWKRPEEPGYQFKMPHRRAPYLVHTNDLGREYDPLPGEKNCYRTSDVLEEFSKWLKENVLKRI